MKYLLSIVATLLLASCSVKKRTYRDGYYIDWAFHKKKTEGNKLEVPKKPKAVVEHNEPVEIAAIKHSEELEASVIASKQKQLFLMDTCGDVIIFKSGDQVTARVTEITDDKIKYKRCDNLDGPLFVVNKSTVALIRYSNGVEEKIEAPKADYSKLNDQNQYKYKGPKKFNVKSILSLICLIIGWFLIGLGIIAAYLLANSALKEIDARPDYYKGRKLANVVKIICKVLFYIGLAILGLFLLLLLLGAI